MYGAGQAITDFVRAVAAQWRRTSASLAPLRARLDWLAERLRFLAVPFPAVLAAVVTLLALLAAVHIGLNIRDESYLWYGAQRVLAGEIPFRDFQSYYDPGRYYWTAAVMATLHNPGVVAMRTAMALCGAIVAWISGRLIFKNYRRPGLWPVLAVAITLIVWTYPENYKLPDIVASVILMALLASFLAQPTLRRTFATGVGLGLVAIIGRNHALYGTVADLAALLLVSLVEKRLRLGPALLAGAAGAAVGYAPMWLGFLLVPGLWQPFLDSIRIYFIVGATNLPVPVPWPWLVPAHLPLAEQLRYVLTGVLLIVQPLYGLTVAGYQLWRYRTRRMPMNPLLLASGLLAVTYTHHAFSRATLGHLAQAIYPMLIGVFFAVFSLPRWSRLALASGICALSVFLLLPVQPLYVSHSRNMETTQIGSDELRLPPKFADYLQRLMALVNKYAPSGREFVVTPYMPGLYAIFDRRAAVWGSYVLSPFTVAEQQREIARIQAERPGFVLIENWAQDRRQALTYWNTNPLVYDYITHHFVRVDEPGFTGWAQLYLSPELAPPGAKSNVPGSQSAR